MRSARIRIPEDVQNRGVVHDGVYFESPSKVPADERASDVITGTD